MKKILPFFIAVFSATSVFAQEDPKPKKNKEKIDMSNRPNDHILLQLGYLGWSGIPDTINTSGLSKSINGYFMFDFPFKTNPKLSMAFGPGVGSDHMVFTKTQVGIKEGTPTIRFTNVSDTNHFKKTKLATVYLEAPVEFRFSSSPLTGNGFKAAIGVKVGTLLSAHTRNTKFQTKDNAALNSFTLKESSKNFFNKNRLVVSARMGYGHFTLYGQYQVTELFKDGFGPKVNPYSFGLTLSGL